eukprot:NODE_500_length_1339_cov_219.700000_g362_i1.p1 GENE.NODE_500_length_1339_cov_219.700000_g362_i1~~NODE_500_length_1339_cov_219.700000_g362_i1.p1  ORF type:complete len:169 (+),score=58.46 NODE_500_length_1339_cov_219.700000_g362_i1:527-1033(+)
MYDGGYQRYSVAGPACPRWFMETYAQKGVAFDRIFAWEAALGKNRPVFWDLVPEGVRAVLSFMEVPLSPRPNNTHSPTRFIRETATAEDFVAFKLDIDHNAVEEAVIQQLLTDPALAGLIDELFWEHHVNLSPMYKWWKGTTGRQTLAESYQWFLKLRQTGIRAHSWI